MARSPRAPLPQLPQDGDILAGKYRIDGELGRGGMGIVFRATHLRLKRPVAIKMLLPESTRSPEARTRFEREAVAAAQLKHRHVAEVLDVEQHEGLPFMVMEFLQGHDLAEELKRRGPLPAGEVSEWILQVCSAMAAAHSLGIIHRDLKPSNLFLAQEEGTPTVKVLDFGISKVLDPENESNLTATTSALGTVLYMSPEHIRSAKRADALSDVWSVGAILYELLAGRPPFSGESPHAVAAAIIADPLPLLSDLRPDLPADLVAVVHWALSKDRAQRAPSMKALAEVLLPFSPKSPPFLSARPSFAGTSSPGIVSLPPPATPSGGLPPENAGTLQGQTSLSTTGFRSAPRWWAVGGVALALLGLLGTGFLVRREPHREELATVASAVSASATLSASSPPSTSASSVSPPASASSTPAALPSGSSPASTKVRKPLLVDSTGSNKGKKDKDKTTSTTTSKTSSADPPEITILLK